MGGGWWVGWRKEREKVRREEKKRKEIEQQGSRGERAFRTWLLPFEQRRCGINSERKGEVRRSSLLLDICCLEPQSFLYVIPRDGSY